MRNLAGLLLVLLVALVLTNMSSFKGLSIIQLDRPNEVSVGTDPGGALGIEGLDDGESGAVSYHGEEELGGKKLGTITNNFIFPVQLYITVEVEFVEADYTGNQEPWWRDVAISIGEEEPLEFQDLEPEDSDELTTGPVDLDPGDKLDISIDDGSKIHLRGTTELEEFLGVARFSITGYEETGALLFEIEPASGLDLRKQYFSWVDGDEVSDLLETTGERYPVTELETINLEGEVGYLQQHDPDSADAAAEWYEAIDQFGDTTLHVLFENPPGELEGTQVLKVLVRRTNNHQNRIPELDIYLRKEEETISILLSGQAVDSSEGQVFTLYFEAEELNDQPEINLEVWLHGNSTNTADQLDNTVEFGAIEWGYVTAE